MQGIVALFIRQIKMNGTDKLIDSVMKCGANCFAFFKIWCTLKDIYPYVIIFNKNNKGCLNNERGKCQLAVGY